MSFEERFDGRALAENISVDAVRPSLVVPCGGHTV